MYFLCILMLLKKKTTNTHDNEQRKNSNKKMLELMLEKLNVERKLCDNKKNK